MNELIDFSSDTENGEKNYNLAIWYESQGHTAAAHTYYLRCAERSEDPILSYSALIRASFCYKSQGSRDVTEKVLLENALILIPERPEAYYFISLLYEKKQDWQNCYIYADLGLRYGVSPLDYIPEYGGKHLLIFQKAVSAWWWGKGNESRNLFDFLIQNYWEDFDEVHKDHINKNLIKLGKKPVGQIFNYPDNFDWADLTEEDITTIQREVVNEKVYRFWNDVKENDIVLDIGASVGAYTISILDQKPKKVYCVEPSKNLLKTLVKNCSEKLFNNLDTSIIYINNGIVINYDDHINVFGNDKSFVPITFKELILKYSIDRVDYMKVDCEGGEYSIFTEENIDFIFNNIKFISIEIHLKGNGFREKFKKFRDTYLTKFNNYKVMSCTRQNISWGNSLDITDKIFDDNFIDTYNCEFMVYIDNKTLDSTNVIKKKFFDCGTHLFQGFNEISKIYNIDSSWECYCFESNPKTYNISKENYLKLINDGLNINYFNAGVSNKNGYANLNLSESTIWDGTEVGTFTGQSSNILLNPPQKLQDNPIKYNLEKEVIRLLDFSSIIELFSNINDFIVVKLDIEGTEFDVIDKLISTNAIKYINEIYVEFHPHFFDDSDSYKKKIEHYKKVFSENKIKFIEWY